MYCAQSLQSCLTLWDSMDPSPPGSSIHGILQAGILEWVALPSSRGFPDPGIKFTSLTSPALAGRFFTTVPPGKQNIHGMTKLNSVLTPAPHACSQSQHELCSS